MSVIKESLADLIERLIPFRENGFEGLTHKEIAEIIDKSPSHVCQILSKLVIQKRICCLKERRNTSRLTSVYYKRSESSVIQANNCEDSKTKRCGNCQRFTGLYRCILLDLVKERGYISDKKLRERVEKETLHPDTPACPYHDKRVNGKYRAKSVNIFIKKNINAKYQFNCPIERCGKIIIELSKSLSCFKIGSATVYCPYCGSPMVMAFDKKLKRYEIRFWDARHDILQQDFRKLMGNFLESRKSAENFGISINKDAYYHLDLNNKFLLLSGSTISSENLNEILYFPIKELDYISTGLMEQYIDVKDQLHVEYITENEEVRRLHDRIKIYEPRIEPQSVEPTKLEVGGNEIFITTKICNATDLRANISSREIVLDAAANNFSRAKDKFTQAKRNIQNYIGDITIPHELDFKYWQQLEGGGGSLMYKPFKKEVRQYGFFAPSREKARNVKGEYFLPFGLGYARSDFHSAINGTNQLIGNSIKEKVYNEIGFAFDGFRGWCHRKYLKGLFYDKFELGKQIALLYITRAIREERLLPSHFLKRRGKRYDWLFCIGADTEGELIIKQINEEVLRSKVVLMNDKTVTLVQAYKEHINLLKKIFTDIAISSSRLMIQDRKSNHYYTPWKILQDHTSSYYLMKKDYMKLKLHTSKYLRNETPYVPLAIQEVLFNE